MRICVILQYVAYTDDACVLHSKLDVAFPSQILAKITPSEFINNDAFSYCLVNIS